MNNDNIAISIVIPCYNDGRFLFEAVQSVEQNQQGRHEIIVVNDGSTDQTTLDVLSTLCQRGHQVLHQANSGPGCARNRGISVAKGRYIFPLDADNRLRSAGIELGIKILDRDPGVDVVYGDAEYFGDKSGRECVPEFNLRRLLAWNYIHASAVFRKSTWERCGGYDEEIESFDDWDFWCRIACSGGSFFHVSEILHEYRVRKDSLSAKVAAKPSREEAIARQIWEKKIDLSMGQYLDAFQSWEPVMEQFRHRPFKTLASLMARTYFPKAYARRLARNSKP